MVEPQAEVDVPERDPESVSRFVEHFAAQLVEAGMPRMPARVFAALLASDTGALTSAELGEQLRISPAAVSGAVRYLAQVHLVSREREPGSRRERYRVHSEQWYEALTNREAIIKRWEEALQSSYELIVAYPNADATIYGWYYGGVSSIQLGWCDGARGYLEYVSDAKSGAPDDWRDSAGKYLAAIEADPDRWCW